MPWPGFMKEWLRTDWFILHITNGQERVKGVESGRVTGFTLPDSTPLTLSCPLVMCKINQSVRSHSFMNPGHGIVVGAIHRFQLNQLIVKCCTMRGLLTGIWQKISIFGLCEFSIPLRTGVYAFHNSSFK